MRKRSYTACLQFEAIKLPPVSDILVLAKTSPHGKEGIMQAFQFIAPDEFELIEVNDEHPIVEAILVNKRILKRMGKTQLVELLQTHVFSHVGRGEAVKVDLSIKINVEGVTGALEEDL